tara:strand:- start:5009 stop:6598 length:1590 start_codon:yes stop_codon:yes gene_type:complete
MKKTKSLKNIIAEEYTKCAADPVYFMKKYCQIQHPTRGRIPFDLYQFQERTLEQFQHNDYNIILKSRQLGISTISAGYSLWLMLFQQDKNVLVIATKQDVAKNLVTKVREMHMYLPSWLKGTTVEDNKLSLRFRNGSQVKAVSSSGDAGRSEALSLLIIDEAAFIDNIDEIWASSQQTLATGGKCIALSTPNGVGNWFHKSWVKAEEGTNNFKTIRLHWSVHPERNKDWRAEQDELLGPKMAAQECDCDFVSSGHNVVDPSITEWYANTHVQDPIETRGFDGNYWIWESCNYNKDYMVVADVARGDGSDFSTFQVIDTETVTQVAEYRGQLTPKDFGNMLVGVATEYNDALLVIENASVGFGSIQSAIDRDYKNLYYTYKQDGVVDATTQLTKGYDLKDKTQMTPGFTTSAKTRPLLISKLDIYLREKVSIIRSKRLIEELRVFIWNGSKAQAQRGYNDDLVMAFSIGMWVRDTALKLKQQGIELDKLAISRIGKSDNTGIYTNNYQGQNPWKMNNGRGHDEDLTWLIK